MKAPLKSIIKDILIYVWEKKLFQKEASILMYHSVSTDSHFFTVSNDEFKWQMNYLKIQRRTVMSFNMLTSLVQEKKVIPKNTVVITFDDGYENLYTNVFPIIKKFNFSITIFLTTGLVGQSRIFKKHETLRLLTKEQIKEMYESGLVSLQPHGHQHLRLIELDRESIKQEVMDSKEYIENLLGSKAFVYAYSWGQYSQNVFSFITQNFTYALTVSQGFCSRNDIKHRQFLLPRQAIDSHTTHFGFALKI